MSGNLVDVESGIGSLSFSHASTKAKFLSLHAMFLSTAATLVETSAAVKMLAALANSRIVLNFAKYSTEFMYFVMSYKMTRKLPDLKEEKSLK